MFDTTVKSGIVHSRSHATGNQSQQRLVALAICIFARALQVNYTHKPPASQHRHNHLTADRIERIQISWVRPHVAHIHRLASLGSHPHQPLPQLDRESLHHLIAMAD